MSDAGGSEARCAGSGASHARIAVAAGTSPACVSEISGRSTVRGGVVNRWNGRSRASTESNAATSSRTCDTGSSGWKAAWLGLGLGLGVGLGLGYDHVGT